MGLLREKKFAPFFWTQFLGAFNDNIFKNAMVLLITFKMANEAESGVFVNLAAGLFILPFFIFSPIAGQIADKFSKTQLIVFIKLAEVLIMIFGALAYYFTSVTGLLIVLFFMGTQSAFFGPVKFSIMPQTLQEDELMEGTGLVEMGTFIAILIGTILGGVLSAANPLFLGLTVIGTAALGVFAAKSIPRLPPTCPNLRIDKNIFRQFTQMWKQARERESIFLSIMAVSWFWFLGAVIMAQLPTFVKHFVFGDETVVTILLAMFTISIATGSLLCEKLSDRIIELGLVPLGSIGLSIFVFDLFLVDYSGFGPEIWGYDQIFSLTNQFSFFRILFDIGMIGFSGSLFIVPLYALIQHRTDESNCSQIIAANNVMNAVFMVGASLLTIIFYKVGLDTKEIFSVVALMNVAVALFVFLKLPEFILRFGIWILAKTVYTLRYEGREHIPHTGSALVVANHISFIDWFILSAACQRPIRFVMYHKIFKIPGLNIFFKFAKAIPIAPEKEDPKIKEEAFKKIAKAIEEEEIVAIFPEGMITHDGELCPFKPGYLKILDKDPIPVIPIVIDGLWGSFFSRKGGKAMAKVPKPSKRYITAKILPPIPAPYPDPDQLQEIFAKELEKLKAREKTN